MISIKAWNVQVSAVGYRWDNLQLEHTDIGYWTWFENESQ